MAIKSIAEKDYPSVIGDYLSGIPIIKLREKYKTSPQVIKSILIENGIHIKSPSQRCQKYSVNKSYFKEIDTEAKAYFLGLIYADGSITKNNKTFELGLSGENEKNLLEIFKDELEFNGHIKKKKKVKESNKQHYRITITSSEFVSSLIEKGVINNKSLILKFPTSDQVPPELIHHFIRGYFDGDGTINFRKTNTLNVGALCSDFFFEDLNKVICENIGFKMGAYKIGNNTEIKISGIVKPIKFCNWIYNNATIFLKRKKDNYDSFVSFLKEREKSKSEFINLKKFKKEENIRLGICTIKTELNKIQQQSISDLMMKNISKRQICKTLNISNSALDNFLRITGQYKVYRSR